jgi:hypothetical protein
MGLPSRSCWYKPSKVLTSLKTTQWSSDKKPLQLEFD